MGMTPKSQGYYFPPEWHPHKATWITFPHNDHSWQAEKLPDMYPEYFQLIKAISVGEQVNINVHDLALKEFIEGQLPLYGISPDQIKCHIRPTNDAWCRDHGPAFLIHQHSDSRMIVDWEYNAWGGKYPPFDDDNKIPVGIAQSLGLPFAQPKIIMEGGSVEFNGAGSLLTSRSCLLNANRNPHLNQGQIEEYLMEYYGVDQVLWVSDGIVGDDTDGHIDDTVRFVNEDTVITVIESNVLSPNFDLLQQNLNELKQMRLINGKQLNIVELPMPSPVIYEEQMLPASYANFYISNGHVVVPTFQCKQDDQAMQIIQTCFPTRQVVGIDSTDIIWGLGSFHCLSQQEPACI